MPAWRIEPLATLDDLDAMIAVEEASFTNPWTRPMYLAELEHPDTSFFYLARDANGRVVGFCSCWRVLDELHINNLAVLPEHRRAGMGSALLEYALAAGVRAGAVRALLEVRASNVEARALYERFGFSVTGTRRGYYSHPVEDALVLSRDDLGPV
jgi:ribosomal-protein-alanine N-acetyltransferase